MARGTDLHSHERRPIDPVLVIVREGKAELSSLAPADPWIVPDPVPPLSLEDLWALVAIRASDPDDPRWATRFDAEQRRATFDRLDAAGLLVEGAAPAGDRRSGEDAAPAVPSADPLSADFFALRQPLVLHLTRTGFRALDHDGRVIADLDPDELWALLDFDVPASVEDAHRAHVDALEGRALTADAHEQLVRRVVPHGLLVPAAPSATRLLTARDEAMMAGYRSAMLLRKRSREVHLAHDAQEDQRRAQTGVRRIKVVPVQPAGNVPPLSTGMVLAAARAFEGGRLNESYDLHPRWIVDPADAPTDDAPVLYLFTNYLWSHSRNLEVAAQIKADHPNALTIHGGPDCPTYPGDDERYLRDHPEVDIMVRGEGERTASELLAALGPSLAAGSLDLSALRGVEGVTFRLGDEFVRNPDRSRIEDVDTIPSPYLEGLFDVFGEAGEVGLAIIETNRGCPYGCTFCDWGSATNSRIRKFDMDRVLAEFTWLAQNKVARVFVADANFGIFARDVDIARHVVELRKTYGYPQRFITNYAKNTVKHLKEIVTVLASGDILTEGLMSLQSMDADTLQAIRRSNIKLEKYEALSREFRQAHLPLFVDLMMGLPGQTFESLRSDFQQCVDREVNAKCHSTELLVNSPMNDPAYREEHRLQITRAPGVTAKGPAAAMNHAPALVVASSTFTRDDYREMHLLRRAYLFSENFGVLRQVTRYVRKETGTGEVQLIDRLRRAAREDPATWPYLAHALIACPDTTVQPGSWRCFLDELRQFVVEQEGVADDDALDAVLAVQGALLPSPGRQLPLTLELPHDYVAWHESILAAKDEGHLHDWPDHVEPLRSFPPGSITVSDPLDVCGQRLGIGPVIEAYRDWELVSPVARAMPGHDRT